MRRYNRYNFSNDPLEMAKYRVEKIRRFYIHLFIYLIAVAIYILKTYFGRPFNFPLIHFLNFTVMAIWTLIIMVQGVKLFIREVAFGSDWENQKVTQIMKEEENQKTWE